VPVEVQVAVLWAVQKGYVDQVPVEQVKQYQTRFTEFLTTRKTDLLAKIAKEGTINDPLAADLKATAEEFKESWQNAHPQAAVAATQSAGPKPSP
jgi:F-type H+-transporting ATPase subunit alpha